MLSERLTLISIKISGIEELQKELNYRARNVEKKLDELCRRLAEIGLQEAQVVLSGVDVETPTDVTVEKIPNGYAVVARGEQIAFIEFGAGVFYNGAEPYPVQRPAGIVGIGEYGKGHGKEEYWYYTDPTTGKSAHTHGTKAAMPMYYATKEMEKNIEKIAREVFR